MPNDSERNINFNVKVELDEAKLDAILQRLDHQTRLLEQIGEKMSALDDTIAQLQADFALLATALGNAMAYIQSVPGQISAAVAAATAAGATPAQLQELTALDAQAKTDVANLVAATPTVAPPAPPAPPQPVPSLLNPAPGSTAIAGS